MCVGMFECARVCVYACMRARCGRSHTHTQTSNTLADDQCVGRVSVCVSAFPLSLVLSFSPYEGHVDFSE